MAYASNNYDLYRFSDSALSHQTEPNILQDKDVIEINDSQQGSYSGGMITFNLSSIQNGDYLDAKGSFVVVPVTTTTTIVGTNVLTATAAQQQALKFCTGLKGADFNIINGCQVQLAGNVVAPLINMSNIYTNFKMLNEMDGDATTVLGESFGYVPDTPTSLDFDANFGEINNVFSHRAAADPASGLASDFPNVNEGFVKRQRNKFGRPNNVLARGDPTNSMRLSRVGYTVVGTTTTIIHTYYCTIQLGFLHDFFDKLPLGRGYDLQVTLSTHLPGTYSYNVTAVTGVPTNFSSVNPYNYVPFISASPVLTGVALGVGPYPLQFSAAVAAGTSVTVRSSIGISGNGAMTAASMYLAMVRPVASIEKTLAANPVRVVKYRDILQFNTSGLLNIAAGNNVWAEIISSISDATAIVIFPYIAKTANGTTNLEPFNTPHSSCGVTTAQNALMYQFQARQSGRNLFSRDNSYATNEYLRLNLGAYAIDGNGHSQKTSGLYGEMGWKMGFGYQYVNLQRRPEGTNKLPVALSLVFQNYSSFMLSYMVFVEYEKEITVNTLTGNLTI